MKTAILISCLFVGGSAIMKNHTPETTSANLPSVKTSKALRDKSMPVGAVRIVVDKSSYELYVYDSKGWFATYPVVFGNSSLEDKKMEGDRNTPEGSFKIASKRVHEK